jgi:hypothetical protein
MKATGMDRGSDWTDRMPTGKRVTSTAMEVMRRTM